MFSEPKLASENLGLYNGQYGRLRNEAEIMTLAPGELNAKEIYYHRTCFRAYSEKALDPTNTELSETKKRHLKN